MNEWENMGDINFVEYGGVMVKQDEERPDDYHFFKLDIDDYDDMYAYCGTVCDIYDYADNPVVNMAALDRGYEADDMELFVKDHPKEAVVALVENYGYGPLEFNARNHNGVGEYSLDRKDFMLSHNELVGFMEKVGIPEGYIPKWQVNFEDAKIKGEGDYEIIDEDEVDYAVGIELPTTRDYCELYKKIFAVDGPFTLNEFKKAQEEKGLIISVNLIVKSDDESLAVYMCCSSPYSLSNIYDVTDFLTSEEAYGVSALYNRKDVVELLENLKDEVKEVTEAEKD